MKPWEPKFGVAVAKRFSDTFTICLLCAVLAAAVLAYVFDADAVTIVTVLVLGVVTAFAETIMRARGSNDGAGRK